MPPALTNVAWAQIRHDYEHTERPVEDICAEHGISSGTLRDRMRRWGWTRRRPPVPHDGPPPLPAPQIDAPSLPRTVPAPAPALPAVPEAATTAASPQTASVETAAPCLAPMPGCATSQAAGGPHDADERTIVPRLHSAMARLLPAIEATVAKLAAGATHPRELERAARTLTALTRTLRELNGLLRQHQAPAAADTDDDESPEDIDAFRLELARRMNALVAARAGKAGGDT